jgi:hypothetical protein
MIGGLPWNSFAFAAFAEGERAMGVDDVEVNPGLFAGRLAARCSVGCWLRLGAILHAGLWMLLDGRGR